MSARWGIGQPMGEDDPLANMRARVAQCRRLAKMIHDPRAIKILLQMAEEGEADIARLQAQRAAGGGELS